MPHTTSLVAPPIPWLFFTAVRCPQMAQVIERDQLLKLQLERHSYTAFMPDDAAMSKFNEQIDADFVNAHLSKLPYFPQGGK